MKKTLTVLVLLGMLAAPAFAQMRMNGWGRAVWVPVFTDQEEKVRSTVQSSYGDQPDLEFMFTASSTNFGVDVGVMVQAQQFNQAANAKVWWKPNNFFKLHVGLGRLTTLRGKVEASTGGYAYARGRITGLTLPSGKDEPILQVNDGDGIFSRFNLTKMGAILEITPMPGLFVGAAFAPEFTLNSGLLAEDVYKGLHVAAGYDIPGIGLVRLGYVGGGADGSGGKTGNAGQNWDFSWDRRLEAAFALTALEGFLIDMGVKYSFEGHPGALDQPGFSLENPLYAALGVMYSGIDKVKIGFALDGHFAGTSRISDGDNVTSAPQIAFNIYPSYDIGFCTLGADFTWGGQFGQADGVNNKQMLGFGVYAHKPYGHGNVRIGVYANAPMNDNSIEKEKFGLSVPLWLTYSF
jgi:hypothetical protein